MNTQIREIWDQAASKTSGNSWEEQVKFISTFALLVVDACIAELEINKDCDIYTGDLFDSEKNRIIDEQIQTLRETFGVE